MIRGGEGGLDPRKEYKLGERCDTIQKHYHWIKTKGLPDATGDKSRGPCTKRKGVTNSRSIQGSAVDELAPGGARGTGIRDASRKEDAKATLVGPRARSLQLNMNF